MKKSLSILISSFVVISCLVSCRKSINEPSSEIIEEHQPFVVKLKQIEYPSEKVKWEQGKNYEIKWAITKNLDKVNIVLLKKFKQVAVISKSTENDGKFSWNIPSDLPGSHHYRIRLISPHNLEATSTSVEFEIKTRINSPIDQIRR